MSLILVYIAIAFTAVALVFTVLPLVGSRRERVRVEFIEEELRMIEALASQRSALLQQLRDLEFDRETDKVSDEDYARFKRLYELQAVGIMRKLDGLRGGQNWDRIVDEEIRNHLADRAPELAADIPVHADAGSRGPSPVAADVPSDDAGDESTEQDEQAEPAVADQEDEPDADEESLASESEPRVDADAGQDDSADGELICGSCGTDLATDDRFCRKCGAPTPSSQDAAEASA